MNFITDKQTLDDLNIFGKRREKSIYGIFNKTYTRGGALLLEEMFQVPFSDLQRIRERSSMIGYFLENQMNFPFRGELFDTIEFYLSNTDNRSRLASEENNLERKVKKYIGADSSFDSVHKGVQAVVEFMVELDTFLGDIGEDSPYFGESTLIKEILATEGFIQLKGRRYKKLSFEKTADLDLLFRYENKDKIDKLLQYVYRLDVYLSVSNVARERNFVIPVVMEGQENMIRIEGMFHPQLETPVSNDFSVDAGSNVIFLTGANMAGKSTFMKTFGIIIFLAHMGFPVPAASMEFTVQNGMYTTINLPDNLNMGYSHFYAEVLRVKKVAQQTGKYRNLIVIFDELFRGTNVKDAYDATVAVAEAFSENKESTFLISTHIIEAGETLKEMCDNVNFIYFPTIMNGKVPTYTYKLTNGITNDRHGMVIINNERIIEIIKGETMNNNI